MIDYFTRADFRRFATNMQVQDREALMKRAEERSPHGATFLSHSSKDKDALPGVVRILENHGASVYIDKKDPTLPPYTNKDTANTLRQRVSQSRRFVLLASENSKESRWVPWELGLADGFKNNNKIALFPVVEKSTDTAWISWEYLGLYDRIVYGDLKGYNEKVWMVLDKKQNTATELARWLRDY